MLEYRWRLQTALRLVLRKRVTENYAAVDQRNCMQTAPARNASGAPIDLIAKGVWDRYPEQAGDNQQISKHRYQQAAHFRAQKGRVKQGLGCEQTKNPKSPHCKEFVHEHQSKYVTYRQSNQKRTTESGELAHLDRVQQPEAPCQTNRKQSNSCNPRARKSLNSVREIRFYQTDQGHQDEKSPRDNSCAVQGQMVNHWVEVH